ncbi:MerR family DNA-binding transcriptional regulator [Actibacterium sp.]|uniref:MerR family transcriptional regulator n=1 Tax=Actibacterium sp. TaxID=1872125 RepID=UPI0035624326
MTETYFTISEMCAEFDVTARTLRFYEDKELLFPKREGQKRLFTRSDRARVKLILQGKRFGFSLEEIRQLLNLYDIDDQQETQLRKTVELSEKHLANLQQKRDELDTAIHDLKTQMNWMSDRLNTLQSEQ